MAAATPACQGTKKVTVCEAACGRDATQIIARFSPVFGILMVCDQCAPHYRSQGWNRIIRLEREVASP